MTKEHTEEMIKSVSENISSLTKTIEDFENLNIKLSKQNTQYAASLIDENYKVIIRLQQEVRKAYKLKDELRTELLKIK